MKFKDNEIKKARKIISEYHMLCNDRNYKEICQDLVTKLKHLTEHDDTYQHTPKIKSKLQNNEDNTINENPQIDANFFVPKQKNQKEYLRPTKSIPMTKSNRNDASNYYHPYSYHDHYHTYGNSHLPFTDTCLLARMLKQSYPHVHGNTILLNLFYF